MQLYNRFQDKTRYGGDNAGLRGQALSIRQLRATERSIHCHKVRTNDAVTSSTGRSRRFYNYEHIRDTIVSVKVLTVNIEKPVIWRDEYKGR